MSSAPLATLQPLSLADVPQAMELVATANWNQTPSDWRRLIEYQPDGCFKAMMDGALVGTVTTTSYQRDLAWIGMMLVDPARRRQGIGRQLMHQAIDYLQSQRVRTIKLDATPAGRPLYAQLGFQLEGDFQRWLRPASRMTADAQGQYDAATGGANAAGAVWERQQAFLDEAPLAELDRGAFGVDRRAWLTRLASDSCVEVREHGFGMLREGRIARYLGPVVAKDSHVAEAIIRVLIDRAVEPIIWDVPLGNPALSSLATELHFEPVRLLSRMWLGEPLIAPLPQCQFALCDPATG